MYFYLFVSCAADELRNLRDEYLSATAEVQKFMEQRFGKRVIQKAVEESFSRDWLKENCKSCPRCGTNIQVWLPLVVTNQLNSQCRVSRSNLLMIPILADPLLLNLDSFFL